jgi:hypothetical protein
LRAIETTLVLNSRNIGQASSLKATHVMFGAQPYRTALHLSCMRNPLNLTVLLQGLANHDQRRAVTPRTVGGLLIMRKVIGEAVD